MITVKELKEILDNLPNDMEVIIEGDQYYDIDRKHVYTTEINDNDRELTVLVLGA